MKKIMIALALVGMSFSGAEAQTKSSGTKETCRCAAIAREEKATHVAHVHRHAGATATSADVYQVCVEKGGHYDCCIHHKKVVKVATN